MADRETVQFKTESGEHTAEIVTYFSRRERRAIKNALFGNKEISVDGKNEVKASVNMANTDLAEDEAIRLGVLKLDDSNENVLERFLELPDPEADAIKSKLDELTGDKSDRAAKEKKGSGPATTNA